MQVQATQAAAEDARYEQEILHHVLSERPTIFRLCDLVRELAKDPEDLHDRDAVERAVRELRKVGLVHRQGDCILPTPAAVYVQEMDLG